MANSNKASSLRTPVPYNLLKLENLTNDICRFYLEPCDKALSIQPGQYVLFHFSDGSTLPFSIANDEGDILEFHIRQGPGHPVAQKALDALCAGGPSLVSGPYGHCTLAQLGPMIFISGGTGISPHKALIDQALKRGIGPITLYWGMNKQEDFYLPDWFKRCQEHDAFEGILILNQAVPKWTGRTGLVHHTALEDPRILEATVYASGPYAMVQAVKKDYLRFGRGLEAVLSDM